MYVMCYFQVLSQPKYVIEDAVVATQATTIIDASTNTSMFNIASAVEAPLEVCFIIYSLLLLLSMNKCSYTQCYEII